MPTASTPSASSTPVRSWPPRLSELPTARPLFELGECRVTHGAQALLNEHGVDVRELLSLHRRGNWNGRYGTTGERDTRVNLDGLATGARLIGFFSLGGDGSVEDDRRVWVGTEAVHPDTGRRWLTTIYLPEEY